MLYRDEITNTNKKGNNKDTKYFEYKQKVWMQVRLLYRCMDDLWESEICIYVDAEISIFTRWLTIVLHRNLQYSWTSQTSGIQMAHNQMTQNLFQFLLYKTKQVVNQLLPGGNRAWTSRDNKIKTHETRKHSSRMRTAHFSDSGGGGSPYTDSLDRDPPPGQRHPWTETQTQTPLDTDPPPPPPDRDSTWTETPPDRDPPGQSPPPQ